ncbi:MAG TPA: diacylglycerol kinase family protein [Candidatus Limosilactobacillus merdigallinarum]|uniref:Diacylglycerol kinase family protein n=1 Tax=Candidatus Limosilactobacillus merdigallinarum TaxID=2838652 RepID=A0A9D2AKV7_9LACO|nr:diacylglycerol kinase family protein [Candidatus Limosilactobacillus merdigallinarum]
MVSPDKHQTSKNRHFIQALGHALNGIFTVVKEERNMRFHVFGAAAVIIVGSFLHLSAAQWLWNFLAITAVFAAEFLNTVVETMCDLIVGHHYDPNVKKAKDVAAGMVLLMALFAVIIGLLVMGPALLKLIGG